MAAFWNLLELQRLIWRCLIETAQFFVGQYAGARLQRLIWRCLIETRPAQRFFPPGPSVAASDLALPN